MATQVRSPTNPWRIAGWTLLAALLLLPAVAMRLTAEVSWAASDFAFAAVLLGGLGFGVEFAVRRFASPLARAGVVLAVLIVFLLVWIEAAVGIID